MGKSSRLHLCPFSKVIAGGYGAYSDGITYLTSAGGGTSPYKARPVLARFLSEYEGYLQNLLLLK